MLYSKTNGHEIPGIALNDDVRLNAGDTIEIFGYQCTGSAIGVVNDSTQSYVAIHKVL